MNCFNINWLPKELHIQDLACNELCLNWLLYAIIFWVRKLNCLTHLINPTVAGSWVEVASAFCMFSLRTYHVSCGPNLRRDALGMNLASRCYDIFTFHKCHLSEFTWEVAEIMPVCRQSSTLRRSSAPDREDVAETSHPDDEGEDDDPSTIKPSRYFNALGGPELDEIRVRDHFLHFFIEIELICWSGQ